MIHSRNMRTTTTTTTTKTQNNKTTKNNISQPTTTTTTTTTATCKKHSQSTAALDILFLIPVLFSIAFLLTSYISYLFTTLSLLLTHHHHHHHNLLSSLSISVPYAAGFLLLFASSLLLCFLCPPCRSRKCNRAGCKGLKKALEFDIHIQTEERLKARSPSDSCVGVGGGEYSNEVIDSLPLKGGSERSVEYERLRNELRKMAPPNGRAVLLFRAKCGCPVAKLEGWAPKKSRRHKK